MSAAYFQSKKLFIIFVSAAILFSGVVAALATLPHTHGKDFSHSQHKSCAVYQASMGAKDVALSVFIFSFVFLLLNFLKNTNYSYQEASRTFYFCLRAPPISF